MFGTGHTHQPTRLPGGQDSPRSSSTPSSALGLGLSTFSSTLLYSSNPSPNACCAGALGLRPAEYIFSTRSYFPGPHAGTITSYHNNFSFFLSKHRLSLRLSLNSVCRPYWLQTHKRSAYFCLSSAGINSMSHHSLPLYCFLR